MSDNGCLDEVQAGRIHTEILKKFAEMGEVTGTQFVENSRLIHVNGLSKSTISKAQNDQLSAGAINFSREIWRKLGDICGMSPFEVDSRIEGFFKPHNYAIAITGPSCAGKSYLTKAITDIMDGEVCTLPLDNFYLNQETVEMLPFRYDDPKSIDGPAAYKAMVGLKHGQTVTIPNYDRKTYKTVGHISVPAKKIILCEGVFAVSTKELRSCFDLIVWVDSRASKRAVRRFTRDQVELGRKPEDVADNYINMVEASYEENLLPLRVKYADLVINNEKDFNYQKGKTKISDLPIGVQVILKYITGLADS